MEKRDFIAELDMFFGDVRKFFGELYDATFEPIDRKLIKGWLGIETPRYVKWRERRALRNQRRLDLEHGYDFKTKTIG